MKFAICVHKLSVSTDRDERARVVMYILLKKKEQLWTFSFVFSQATEANHFGRNSARKPASIPPTAPSSFSLLYPALRHPCVFLRFVIFRANVCKCEKVVSIEGLFADTLTLPSPALATVPADTQQAAQQQQYFVVFLPTERLLWENGIFCLRARLFYRCWFVCFSACPPPTQQPHTLFLRQSDEAYP